tara:strand:- start:330 stop:827 length:498 start_codon:yes stop_codon:yes gene_type:complete
MAFKLDKSNFNFGKGVNRNADGSPMKVGWQAKDVLKHTANFMTGMGEAGKFNPFLGENGVDVQGGINMLNDNWNSIQQGRKKEKEINELKKKLTQDILRKKLSEKHKRETEKTKPKSKGTKQEPKKGIPAVGTEARKKYYDSKNWKYDDTIKGYNRDGTKKKTSL